MGTERKVLGEMVAVARGLVVWLRRINKDDGDDYLNGEDGDERNGWDDIEDLGDRARAALKKLGV